MTELPYDYCRCPGTTHRHCTYCQRQSVSHDDRMYYMIPPASALEGKCPERIPM
jgi:hypothetical protein